MSPGVVSRLYCQDLNFFSDGSNLSLEELHYKGFPTEIEQIQQNTTLDDCIQMKSSVTIVVGVGSE